MRDFCGIKSSIVMHGTANYATGVPAVDNEKQQVTFELPNYEPGGREGSTILTGSKLGASKCARRALARDG